MGKTSLPNWPGYVRLRVYGRLFSANSRHALIVLSCSDPRTNKKRSLLKVSGRSAMPTALSHAIQGKKTNVILIMTDDTGYEVFGCYGSQQYKTPRVDRLAETGMRFNHCYSNPVCAPSRVKIMTGKSNVRNYVHWGILDPGEKTLGHMMKDAGYATCVAVKVAATGRKFISCRERGDGAPFPGTPDSTSTFCYDLDSGEKRLSGTRSSSTNGQSKLSQNTYRADAGQ